MLFLRTVLFSLTPQNRTELRRRMLRDTYRRRLLAAGDRTVTDVHASIASSVAHVRYII
jgi:hypothetical protein